MSHVRHIHYRAQRERRSAGPIVARLKSWLRRRSFLPQQQPSLRPTQRSTALAPTPHAVNQEPQADNESRQNHGTGDHRFDFFGPIHLQPRISVASARCFHLGRRPLVPFLANAARSESCSSFDSFPIAQPFLFVKSHDRLIPRNRFAVKLGNLVASVSFLRKTTCSPRKTVVAEDIMSSLTPTENASRSPFTRLPCSSPETWVRSTAACPARLVFPGRDHTPKRRKPLRPRFDRCRLRPRFACARTRGGASHG